MSPSFQARKRSYYKQLKQLLNTAKTTKELHKTIVNAPFHDPLTATYIHLGVVVFLQVSEDGKSIKRVSLSDTESAQGAVRSSEKKFHNIIIPLKNKQNIIAKAITAGKMQQTDDWEFLFTPALTPESARFNQAGAGIAYSRVAPLPNSKSPGAIIFSFFQRPSVDNKNQREFVAKYVKMVDDILGSRP